MDTTSAIAVGVSVPVLAVAGVAGVSSLRARNLWLRLGKLCNGCCTCFTISREECAHGRLERMLEERQRQLAEAKARKAIMAEEEVCRAKKWQEELKELEERRIGMTDEELDQDCASHFAALDYIHSLDAAPCSPTSASAELTAADVLAPHLIGGSRTAVEPEGWTVAAGPQDVFESWLQEHFGNASSVAGLTTHGGNNSPQRAVHCAADLPTTDQFAESLAKALIDSANELDQAADDALGMRPAAMASVNGLDCLIQKYIASEGKRDEADFTEQPDDLEECMAQSRAADVDTLRAKAVRYRDVGQRLTTLLPSLRGDLVSSRFAAALAVLGAGEAGNISKGINNSGSIDRLDQAFLRPTRALSTADVCWALCSEKRRLMLELALPGVGAEGDRWCWGNLRHAAVGWWLHGVDSVELLETVVTKMSRFAMVRLRKHIADTAREFETRQPDRKTRDFIDEVIFWLTVLSPSLSKLQALHKTGVISGDPGLNMFFKHSRLGQVEFMRKNAFACRKKHRFRLAASIFLLNDCTEDAARVVAGDMHDVQLMLVLARRHPDLAAKLLRRALEDSPLASQDPWLRLLVAWHAGDRGAELRGACGVALEGSNTCDELDAAVEDDGAQPLFDGALRLCVRRHGLAEVVETLLIP